MVAVAGFAAANIFLEDGWRDNSPSRVNSVFGKGSYRGDKLDLNLSTLVTWNDLTGNGMLPSEMYQQDRRSVFTSPDTTDNRLLQFQLSGNYFVNDNFSITGQVYRRNSKRKQRSADVYTEFENQIVRRNLAAGEQYTCIFNSTNQYGIPDYAVVEVHNGIQSIGILRLQDPTNPLSIFSRAPSIDAAFSGLPADSINQELPDYFVEYIQAMLKANQNWNQNNLFIPGAENYEAPTAPDADYSVDGPEYSYVTQTTLSSMRTASVSLLATRGLLSFYYYTEDGEGSDPIAGDNIGVKHVLLIRPPANAAACQGDVNNDGLKVPGPDGGYMTVDGAAYNNGTGTGEVEGTPTAVITNTQIDQITDGASLQFNWNYEKHKFMVGASVDMPWAKYKSGQMLGMFDAERDGYLAPNEIRDQYAAASEEISNSNFSGRQVTKSIYASETWTPIETLSITGAVRYNDTRGKNKIASRTYGSYVWNLAQLESMPNYYDICLGSWLDGNCANNPTTGYGVPDASNLLNASEKEKFSYHSLNPSLGATWQATPNLNIYGNFSEGTRVPSVVELGCAFDRTPVVVDKLPDDSLVYAPRSLAENRFCSLPTTLSGDPYLPQIKATTLDLGMRGRFNENVEWNLGIYRTNLRDDIYMVGYPGNRNFFDTIGDTRRQGLEAGITAAFEKWRLRLNYALTEATFQDAFLMPANDNSSSVEDVYGKSYSRLIQVKPGNRMPGVPLHNLNATLSYLITPKWQIGLTAVAHSFAFVRGNENNKHRAGEVIYDSVKDDNGVIIPVVRQGVNNPGTTPGYMVLNLQTSYQLTSEWTLGLRVNNLLDKEYFSAGRLGRNPFSPSVYGAIGPDGYNHNSNDWLMTNFLAPGAPRAAWISLSYSFDPRK